ncbi:MAG: DUF2357 domain-containing protein [Clostridia bacterium]|nr:DUF2357 domain-containing protein [Clostridia bacterium]
MDNLGIIDLYQNDKEKNSVKQFAEKTDSTLRVETDRKTTTLDTEWLDMIEDTIQYIDNIFRSPNRFIVNEEEVVKVEQAKKITVETIKHLSKNTNFIQTIDPVTGDVTPSKLLNIRKEESYDTYENRLIYTLVQNTKMFIKRRKEELLENIDESNNEQSSINNKALHYNATSIINGEKVNANMNLSSALDAEGDTSKDKVQKILERIEEVEKKIEMLGDAEPYQVIDRQRISLVREPIKKTNVVLKNVNFQYAMKLWSYLRDNYNIGLAEDEEHLDYNDTGELKQFIDETFLLQYIAMKTLDEDKQENESTHKEIQETMVDQMIEKMIDMDVEVTEQQLTQMIAQRYEVIKYKKTEIIKEIQQIFKTQIEKYEEQVEKRG